MKLSPAQRKVLQQLAKKGAYLAFMGGAYQVLQPIQFADGATVAALDCLGYINLDLGAITATGRSALENE